MSKVEEFEKLLKAAVKGKGLSQSKMTALTELAQSNFEYDTQMVSTLYRNHKNLPPESKVPSLYLFDSLARAARSRATKTHADPKSPVGNAATFLAKIEGVLDGLIQDVLATDAPEAKEKTLKVLDIWTKASTFPPPVLARLNGYTRDNARTTGIDNANSQPSSSTASGLAPSTVDPRQAPPDQSGTSSLYQAATPDTAGLLALLAQAQATVATAGPDPPTPTTAAPIDASQLALLQQIAGNLAQPSSSSDTNGQTSGHSPYANRSPEPPYSRDYRSDYPRRNYDDRSPPPRDRDHRGDRYDDRDRRRGFGDRSRFDDRDGYGDRRGGRYYDRENDRGASRRGRWDDRGDGSGRRRSRSPLQQQRDGGYGGSQLSSRPPLPERSGQESPLQSSNPSRHGSSGSFSAGRRETRSPPPGDGHPAYKQGASPAVNASAIPAFEFQSDKPAEPSSQGTVDGQGLQGYDFTTFDPMNPTSWSSLGKAWEVSYGKPPTQEELMLFVMSGGMGAAGMMTSDSHGSDASTTPAAPSETSQIPTWESGNGEAGQAWNGHQQGFQNHRGRGRGRGRGFGYTGRGGYDAGGGHQDGRNGYGGDGYGGAPYSGSLSDAVVLGSGDGSSSMSPAIDGALGTADSTSNASDSLSGTKATKSGMFRVGGRWQWVKAGDVIP
ncbi:hypothetical protein FRB90_006414 [Tulasnella sp. 427]|nr:hypothetical protein FRB90_006414 [Tulasnella sp. 427]